MSILLTNCCLVIHFLDLFFFFLDFYSVDSANKLPPATVNRHKEHKVQGRQGATNAISQVSPLGSSEFLGKLWPLTADSRVLFKAFKADKSKSNGTSHLLCQVTVLSSMPQLVLFALLTKLHQTECYQRENEA